MNSPSSRTTLRKRSIVYLSPSTNLSQTFIPKKRFRNYDHSSTLPNEILLQIFSYLSHTDLYKTVRCVCKRWYLLTSSPVLWKKISVRDEVPSHILCKWIEHSPLLKELNLRERDDVNAVTEKVSKYCKRLQTLKIENSSRAKYSKLVRSRNLCQLLTKCKYLNNLYFSGVKILSCKFFKLLSKRKHFGVSKCSYYGPVSQKQMRALIESIISSDSYDAATLFTANNRKIAIKEISSNQNPDTLNVPMTVENIWEDIVNSTDDVIDDDVNDLDYQLDQNDEGVDV